MARFPCRFSLSIWARREGHYYRWRYFEDAAQAMAALEECARKGVKAKLSWGRDTVLARSDINDAGRWSIRLTEHAEAFPTPIPFSKMIDLNLSMVAQQH